MTSAIYSRIVFNVVKCRCNVIQFEKENWFENGELKVFLIETLSGLEIILDQMKKIKMTLDNNISIRNKLFDKWKNLQHIDLDSSISYSSIKSIEPESFDNLTKLSRLILSCNSTLPEFIFENLKNLKELALFTAGSLKLNKNHFFGLDKLEILHLKNAEFMEEIEFLNGLKEFRLENYRFNEFSFKKFENLEKLYLINFKLSQNCSIKIFEKFKNF